MRGDWNAAITSTAGVIAGFLLGFTLAAMWFVTDAQRGAIGQWLYDWQQLNSGLLAIGAAGFTAWLLWRQAGRKGVVPSSRADTAGQADGGPTEGDRSTGEAASVPTSLEQATEGSFAPASAPPDPPPWAT